MILNAREANCRKASRREQSLSELIRIVLCAALYPQIVPKHTEGGTQPPTALEMT